MTKRLLLTLLLVLCAASLAAQSFSAGFSVGGAESLEDGLDLNLGNFVREIYFGTDLEMGTTFRIKAGQAEFDEEPRAGKIEYVQALVDYEFHEVFGSTTLSFGPAFYRHRPGGEAGDESEFGLSGGVSGEFPFTRTLAFTAELTYHWINFDDPYRFLTATGGLKVNF